MGRSQAVRQRILIPPCGGSNPPAPARETGPGSGCAVENAVRPRAKRNGTMRCLFAVSRNDTSLWDGYCPSSSGEAKQHQRLAQTGFHRHPPVIELRQNRRSDLPLARAKLMSGQAFKPRSRHVKTQRHRIDMTPRPCRDGVRLGRSLTEQNRLRRLGSRAAASEGRPGCAARGGWAPVSSTTARRNRLALGRGFP